MKSLLFFLVALAPSLLFAKSYELDSSKSLVSWHLHISKSTEVYGDIPVSGNFEQKESQFSGKLTFSLDKTKSYEVEGEKREFSDSRDSRIYSITEASKTPTFVIKNIKGFAGKAAEAVEVLGTFTLHGISKEISIHGKVNSDSGKLSFLGEHKINWEEYKVSNPVMFFLRMTKTADKFINLKFKLVVK